MYKVLSVIMYAVRRDSGRLCLLMVTLLLCIAGSATADVQLPNIFSDSLVLQRGRTNRVWGRAGVIELLSEI